MRAMQSGAAAPAPAKDPAMDTSLISALFSAQVGQLQLAVAASLARMDPQAGSSVAQLVDAAQQSFAPLANVPAGLGTNLNISV